MDLYLIVLGVFSVTKNIISFRQSKQFMNPDAIAKLIVEKGLKNVNLSMFTDSEKKSILQEAAEVFLRQGKTADLLEILEYVDLKKFADMMRPLAENCVEQGEYKKAAQIYEKIGYGELAEFIRLNFVQ